MGVWRAILTRGSVYPYSLASARPCACDSFHGEAGELRFSRGVLAADANGYTKADFEIALTGLNSLNESHDLLLA